MIKRILVKMVIVSMLLTGIAAAVEDVNIYPVVDPIIVGVDPNPISPPVSVLYTGWTTSGGSTYDIEVTNDVTSTVVCTASGTITSDPMTVTLPACKIPAASVGVSHTITASGDCDRPDCINPRRSKHLGIDAGLNPVPEMSTGILISAGLIGLVGLVRYRKK